MGTRSSATAGATVPPPITCSGEQEAVPLRVRPSPPITCSGEQEAVQTLRVRRPPPQSPAVTNKKQEAVLGCDIPKSKFGQHNPVENGEHDPSPPGGE